MYRVTMKYLSLPQFATDTNQHNPPTDGVGLCNSRSGWYVPQPCFAIQPGAISMRNPKQKAKQNANCKMQTPEPQPPRAEQRTTTPSPRRSNH